MYQDSWISDLPSLFRTDEDVVRWLTTKHPQLDNRSPLEAIRESDEFKVATIVDQLASGAYL